LDYHTVPLTRKSLLALALNLFWLAGLVWLVIRAVRRSQSRWSRWVCEAVFFLLWLPPLDFCRRFLLDISPGQLLRFFKQPLGILALLVLLVCFTWKHRWFARAAAVATAIMSPLAFINLVGIALAIRGLEHPSHQITDPPLAPLSPVREGQARVVWIIFDEADQRLGFEQRPANLQMPEFDRFVHESLYATNAYPPGTNTLESLPGLTTGQRILMASIKNARELELTLADTGKVVLWEDLPSVFDSARALGVNTALVGWHHPYDRVLGRSLNYCSWYPFTEYELVRGPTVGGAMLNQLGCLALEFHLRGVFAGICRASLADSLALVTNSTYGLVFLHLPPPHTPGVFNAATGRFTVLDLTAVQGYFGNLALADRALRTLRKAMEASGQWDRTWVILSADHSWRDSRRYDGQRDHRIPFLIKAPGANQPAIYSPEVNTVVTKDLVLSILRGGVTNQQQAIVWLDAHPAPRLPPPASSANK
jgi:hypothetical protein